jgi:S-adenosyl-L-methionine hydrolase (adenosine-forming)
MAKRALVTFTTDFGTDDPYVGAMKGTLLRYCPTADIVDITHSVPVHQIAAGAFILGHSAPYFPPGTMHVVVVDPGVGTDRSLLVGQFGGQVYIFPDNGVISLIKQTQPLEGLVSVRNYQFLGDQRQSSTFHGRDIIAPLAGHILSGGKIDDLGPTPQSFKMLDMPTCDSSHDKVTGQVMYLDHFGNLVTNITREDLRQLWEDPSAVRVTCRGQQVGPVQMTYGQTPPGKPLALINSMGLLEVAVNLGAAVDHFQAGIGAEVTVTHPEFLDVS